MNSEFIADVKANNNMSKIFQRWLLNDYYINSLLVSLIGLDCNRQLGGNLYLKWTS